MKTKANKTIVESYAIHLLIFIPQTNHFITKKLLEYILRHIILMTIRVDKTV
jgi:hypothetical protein